MNYTVKRLLAQIIQDFFYDDPRETQVTIQMCERDEDGNVTKIEYYPISMLIGSCGGNRICIEKSEKLDKAP